MRKSDTPQYEQHKAQASERQRVLSTTGRDIGKLPPIKNRRRRDRCERDLRVFCETYFGRVFSLAWSPDHLKVIAKLEHAILYGGLFAMAMPRGNGKTSLCEVAAIWALLYGHRLFVAIVGPDEDHAAKRVEGIRIELEHNQALGDDFPEVCYPIRRLEGINQRRLLYRGKRVRMEFTAKKIMLPAIRGEGGIVETTGITGQIRGLNHKTESGQVLRPTLVLIDDPQTRESAHSLSQCKARASIINGDILGLAGPGSKIAAVMPCTVIREGDVADEFLDREKNPQWQGERTKMVNRWPTNDKLWLEYSQVRKNAQRDYAGNDAKITEVCNEFYAANRAAMDDGAEVAWEARIEPGDLSAIQHAWNLRIKVGDRAFFAEYQNEPMADNEVRDELTIAEIAKKTNGRKRGIVPLAHTNVTAFIDVQQAALFWLVAAWSDDFSGAIVDYGTEPDQRLDYFTLQDVRRTLAKPGVGIEGAITAGLDTLTKMLLGRQWQSDDGTARISRLLIDANWGVSTNVVYEFCRASPFSAMLLPSHGRYFGASSRPMSEWQKKPGDKYGLNWRTQPGPRRHVTFDTNFWKSFVYQRLAVATGDTGSLSMCEGNHRMLLEHLTSEFRVKTEGRGRKVDEWRLRTGRDNHWFDCLVGSAVAASINGATLPGTEHRTKRRRVSFAEMQAKARAEVGYG